MSPAWFLGILIATLGAAVFHTWKGRSWREGLVTWGLALLGFGLGQALGNSLGWKLGQVGELNLPEALAGCVTMMALGRWIQGEEKPDLNR